MSSIWYVVFTQDGKSLVSASLDEELIIWNINSGK